MLNALFAALTSRQFKKGKGTSDSKVTDQGSYDQPTLLAIFLFIVTVVVQLVVLALVLCLVTVLYLLGLYISTGVALWRLIEHDYGNAEGSANLKPALNVLYSLAVAQGVLFGYKTLYDLLSKPGLVEKVASRYSLDTDLVSHYLDETMTGCMKDPSFARGRNLVRYGVDLLMETGYELRYYAGVTILGTILQPGKAWPGQSELVLELLTGSASLSHMAIHRLLEMIGPTSPYKRSREIREQAVRIVQHVAGRIHLEEQLFPGGRMIQCVSFLLDTVEEREQDPMECETDYWLLEEQKHAYLQRAATTTAGKSPKDDSPLHGYRGRLVVQGLCILQKLLVHEDNCGVMLSRHSQGLVSKIMARLLSPTNSTGNTMMNGPA